MMTVCDNAEQIRRRGRWASLRVMEVYLQEVMASTYLNQISEGSKQKILLSMNMFPQLLAQAIKYDASQIPATTWYFCFDSSRETELMFKVGFGWLM